MPASRISASTICGTPARLISAETSELMKQGLIFFRGRHFMTSEPEARHRRSRADERQSSPPRERDLARVVANISRHGAQTQSDDAFALEAAQPAGQDNFPQTGQSAKSRFSKLECH
jgi:hypothetical protein